MLSLLVRRLAMTVPTIILLSLAVFLMVKAIPGDTAQLMLGDKANETSLRALRQELGLDQPLIVQYFIFFKKTFLHGDLGRSVTTGESITSIIADKFPATVELSIAAMLIAVVVGLPLGVLAAVKKGSLFDFLAISTSVAGVSMPVFWLGLVLLWVFGLQWQLLPISGRIGIELDYTPMTGFLILDAIMMRDTVLLRSALDHLLLPALTLSTIPLAYVARLTRASMVEVMKEDYVRTARAKGLSSAKIVLKHSLNNALPSIVTMIGLQLGGLLAGAMITETVFAWPGIGTWILASVSSRDIPSLEAGVLLVAMTFIVVNFMVDLLLRFLDPRIRVS